MTDVFNDLLGDNAVAFKFENVGDTCKGKVVKAERKQARDIETGAPKFFKNSGDPIMQLIVTVAQDNGDGETALYFNGGKYEVADGKGQSALEALRSAVGDQAFAVGGQLAMQYSGNGKKTNPAYSAPKLYTVQYKAPAISLDDGESLI